MIIAITGGIGSGKSYVCNRLSAHGIQVYDSDAAAKRLMRTSIELQEKLSAEVGEAVFKDGALQKAVLAKYLLQSSDNAAAINNIVHPAVATDFEQSGYTWIESAILFDSDFIHRTHIDKVVCVLAPEAIRVERIMARDGISEAKALAWIHRQMAQEEVAQRSDYTILNDGKVDVNKQISQILEQLEINK
ncbi:dephospho-CoA kinase [Prevotella ihumii]|uniref:dephospho-CoA kinase n=1 Tax=Prevotella ihumii TaxID=1917878 RepID=UPI0009820BF0|nr:dephospho-CoA kinase [Prevotella ihumii]